jgi:hypothetical protein
MMVDSERNKVHDRIQKLRRLAENSGATEGEVLAAMAGIRRIMEEYGIDEADTLLDESQTEAVFASVIQEEAYSRANNLERWHSNLARCVGDLCDVSFFIRTGYGHKSHSGKREAIYFYGLKKDVAVAKSLFAELCVTARFMARLRYGTKVKLPVLRAYCVGLSLRLAERARKEKQQGENVEQIHAIVLRKDILLKRYAREKLNLRTTRSRNAQYKHSDAHSQGYADGANVSLGSNGLPGGGQGRLE